jgi:hypothetical protein
MLSFFAETLSSFTETLITSVMYDNDRVFFFVLFYGFDT